MEPSKTAVVVQGVCYTAVGGALGYVLLRSGNPIAQVFGAILLLSAVVNGTETVAAIAS